MNEFETRQRALRLQFADEQRQITKSCSRTIGHLNQAISQVKSHEAREALWKAKARAKEEMRNSHAWNLKLYCQQVELLNEEFAAYRRANPSKEELKRSMARLCHYADPRGLTSMKFYVGSNRVVEITIKDL